MDVLVADANVFVFLFLTNLLTKILDPQLVRVMVPEEVYVELTSGRLQRDYPALAQIITKARYNQTANLVIDVRTQADIEDITAMRVFCELESSNLGDGERAAIPLAIQHDIPFVTWDEDALTRTHDFGGVGLDFVTEFCEQLFEAGVINQAELESLREIVLR